MQQLVYQTFKMGLSRYGVAASASHGALDVDGLTPMPRVRSEIRGLMSFNGRVIPVLAIAERLGNSSGLTGQLGMLVEVAGQAAVVLETLPSIRCRGQP